VRPCGLTHGSELTDRLPTAVTPALLLWRAGYEASVRPATGILCGSAASRPRPHRALDSRHGPQLLHQAITHDDFDERRSKVTGARCPSRDEQAKKCGYDLHAICEDVRKKEAASGRKVVTRLPRKPAVHDAV
jgi:hypothetical protein